jgi:hypothetical protein
VNAGGEIDVQRGGFIDGRAAAREHGFKDIGHGIVHGLNPFVSRV